MLCPSIGGAVTFSSTNKRQLFLAVDGNSLSMFLGSQSTLICIISQGHQLIPYECQEYSFSELFLGHKKLWKNYLVIEQGCWFPAFSSSLWRRRETTTDKLRWAEVGCTLLSRVCAAKAMVLISKARLLSSWFCVMVKEKLSIGGRVTAERFPCYSRAVGGILRGKRVSHDEMCPSSKPVIIETFWLYNTIDTF